MGEADVQLSSDHVRGGAEEMGFEAVAVAT